MDQQPARTSPQTSAEDGRALRELAEARSTEQPASPTAGQLAQMPLATQHLLQELQVHPIELEMQNEELRRAQEALDTALFLHGK